MARRRGRKSDKFVVVFTDIYEFATEAPNLVMLRVASGCYSLCLYVNATKRLLTCMMPFEWPLLPACHRLC